MSEHIYEVKKLEGSSTTGTDDAIKNAIAKAAADNADIRWFEVVETRGHVENGAVAHWQVTVNIGCRA